MFLRAFTLTLLLAIPAPAAKLTAANVAAITTITVNVLEIKTHIRNARAAARATKKTVKAIGKKVAGK